MYDAQVFFTPRANADRFPTPDALCGKRVAASRSSTVLTGFNRQWSDENCVKFGKPSIDLVLSENAPASRLMMMQNRADASITGASDLFHRNKMENNQWMQIGMPVGKLLTGMAFRKDDMHLGEALKKALSAVIADGTYARVMRKWGFPEEAFIQQPMFNGQP